MAYTRKLHNVEAANSNLIPGKENVEYFIANTYLNGYVSDMVMLAPSADALQQMSVKICNWAYL